MSDFLKSVLNALQTLILGDTFVSHVIGFVLVLYFIYVIYVLVKGEKKND